jgi:hypothetical protein
MIKSYKASNLFAHDETLMLRIPRSTGLYLVSLSSNVVGGTRHKSVLMQHGALKSVVDVLKQGV